MELEKIQRNAIIWSRNGIISMQPTKKRGGVLFPGKMRDERKCDKKL